MFQTAVSSKIRTRRQGAETHHGLRFALRSFFSTELEHRDGPQVVEPMATRAHDGSVNGVLTSIRGPRPPRL